MITDTIYNNPLGLSKRFEESYAALMPINQERITNMTGRYVIANSYMGKTDFSSRTERKINLITDINIIVPNKVVEVTFSDGKKERMVCHKDDTFNLRNCLFIAIAKHKYKKDYTYEGIEWKAFEMTHLKEYVKIVDVAIKEFDKKQKAIEKAEKEKVERLEYAKRRHERKLAKKARKEQEARDRQIAIQKDAYIQAMMAIREKDAKEYSTTITE